MLSKLGLPVSIRTSGHIVVCVCIIIIVFNLLEALQLAYLWSALKWETETEWDSLRLNGVRVAVGLVCGYLIWTCLAAFIGLVGALKHNPTYLRFFRDCTIVDIVFTFMFTIVTAFSASRQATRTIICEQLSRQPELLRNIANTGLNFENCELWFQNAVTVFLCVMFITLVMRVQFTFTLSNLYSRLHRKQRIELEPLDTAPQRILLLPPSSTDIPLVSSDIPQPSSDTRHVVVYAPVRHTLETAHELGATEAWVSRHRHTHSHSHSHHSGRGRTGQIRLEIEDGEGLLPINSSSLSNTSTTTATMTGSSSVPLRSRANSAGGGGGGNASGGTGTGTGMGMGKRSSELGSVVDSWRDPKRWLKQL
ncbi:hypothetical protein FRB91_005812 [Serendipita sp. 411]|nr:hypothetical protein FRB91_005812 [Serendipita sp. 411]KAG9041212.1 hypothetical protein FS842_002676 [Serendipita sp. 407]